MIQVHHNETITRLMAMNPFELNTISFKCSVHGESKAYVRKSDGSQCCEECLNESALKLEREASIKQAIKSIGLFQEHLECRVSNYKPETTEEIDIRNKVIGWIENFSLSSNGFLMIGGTGTGKTHLLSSIAKAIVLKGYWVKYKTTESINTLITSTWARSEITSTQDVINSLCETHLLIIDEIGASRMPDGVESNITEIINRRSSNKKPTILCSNLDRDDVKRAIGDRIYSRTCQSILTFSGRDRRAELNKAW